MTRGDGTCRRPSGLPSPGRCFRRSRRRSAGLGVHPREPGTRLAPCPRVRTVCLGPHSQPSHVSFGRGIRSLLENPGRNRDREPSMSRLGGHLCVDPVGAGTRTGRAAGPCRWKRSLLTTNTVHTKRMPPSHPERRPPGRCSSGWPQVREIVVIDGPGGTLGSGVLRHRERCLNNTKEGP
jgi:hypothetical protein